MRDFSDERFFETAVQTAIQKRGKVERTHFLPPDLLQKGSSVNFIALKSTQKRSPNKCLRSG